MLTNVVTAVERQYGTAYVTVGRDVDGKIFNHTVYAVSPYAVRRAESSTGPFDPPLLHLRLPVMAGDKWDVSSTRGGIQLTGTVTVIGTERVEVPAGAFNAVRVEFEFVDGTDSQLKTTYWYAPGVGEVKRSTQGGAEVVLKSFTPGKD